MEKALEERMLIYRTLEKRLEALSNQQSAFASKIVEIQNTLSSIEEVKRENADIFFPLGSAAYVKGKVSDREKIIVELGANVAIEKSMEEGKKILEKRKKELEDAIGSLQNNIQSIVKMMQQIEMEVQGMVSKAQEESGKFKVVNS